MLCALVLCESGECSVGRRRRERRARLAEIITEYDVTVNSGIILPDRLDQDNSSADTEHFTAAQLDSDILEAVKYFVTESTKLK